MLTIQRTAGRLLPRRDFLQAGLLGPLGLSMLAPRLSRGSTPIAAQDGFGRAKRCILVFLNGGPSQLDLWDMKPAAPLEVRGPLKPIATTVPGIHLSELLPLTARHADRFKMVRSVTHEASVHTTAWLTMLTGTPHATPKVDQTRARPDDPPHLGSVLARYRGWQGGMPPFVTVPMLFYAPPVEGVWPGMSAGFLGRRYDPFVITGDKQTAQFGLPAVELPADISPDRLAARRSLQAALDRSFRAADNAKAQAHATSAEQAFALLGASRLVAASDLSREPEAVRERYGHHLFGQGLLLARRLVEAEVPLVTVYWVDPTPPGPGGGEFDSHGQIYRHMRERLLPPTDRALSALLADLHQRGLFDDTLLVVMSEFGRSPRLNDQGGRDHWPQVQSILLAGAGISGGTVYGASDRNGAYPAESPVTPADLAQNIFHLLGVPADYELHDTQGRPLPACRGSVLPKLLA